MCIISNYVTYSEYRALRTFRVSPNQAVFVSTFLLWTPTNEILQRVELHARLHHRALSSFGLITC